MESSPLEIVRLRKHQDRYKKILMKRSEGDVAEALPKVQEIVSDVRKRGNLSLLNYTKKFDEVELSREEMQVSGEEFSQAYEKLEEEKVEAIEEASEAIKEYHQNQLPEDWMKEFRPGVEAGQIVRPLKSVGCYAPGGNAQYPSSVLMSVVPAKVSGVEKVTVCTPPNSDGGINPAILVAADVAGADEVYKAGGAQAIAAMAYGTQTIPSVEKIVGPGNVYVAAAKKAVSLDVDIDFMAGPSEILILADSSANPRLIALDMIAQAEHDPSSASVLVTTSEKLAEAVKEEIGKATKNASRRRTIEKSLEEYGHAIVVRSLKRAKKFVNDYAPEHLQIMTKNPEKVLEGIENAGAVFLGPNSPVSAGDFAVGPSHILPTGGEARRYNGISVDDFIRKISIQKLSEKGLENLSEILERFSEMENLPAHAQSIKERLED